MVVKSKYLAIVVVLGILILVLVANFFMVRKDVEENTDKTIEPVPVEQNLPAKEDTIIENTTAAKSEEERTAALQACLIGVLGPDRILKLQSGELTITPAIQAKIEECTGKIDNF